MPYQPPGGGIPMNVGGPHRQIRHADEPRAAEACVDCTNAREDLTNPRDHCTKHDHVIREAP